MKSLTRKYPNYAEAHASLAAALWADGQAVRCRCYTCGLRHPGSSETISIAIMAVVSCRILQL